MEILITLAASAGLFVAVEVLWRRRGWLAARSAAVPTEGESDEDDTFEWKLFSEEFIQRRLNALAEELERLDDDPDVFAKAFHTVVARSAYEALLADSSRRPHRYLRYASPDLDLEFTAPSSGVREVLDL